MLKVNPKDTKAIFIGVSEYQDKANFVSAAPIKNNVPKIKALLQDPLILGLPDENILVYTQNERHDEILDGIESFLDKEFTDTVIFYFAGHGYKTTNGDFYMVTNNSNAKRIKYTALPWSEIKNILQKGSGIQQRFYILDACHSGAATLSADDNLLEIEKGSALIAAASEDENAYFDKKNTFTDFSNAFIQTLENGADNIELEAFDANYIHDNINKILKQSDNRFDTQIKKTDKIDNVAFFKNKKYDKKEIERRKKQAQMLKKKEEIEKIIEKAKKHFENLDFEKAELFYSRALRKAEPKEKLQDLIEQIDKQINKIDEIKEYKKIFENFYKTQNQQKIDELNQQITQLKTKNTANEKKLHTQLNKEKENYKTLFSEKKEIEKHLKTKETEINELTKEDKAIYDKLLSEKKTIEQQLTEKNNEIIKQTKTINDLKKRLTQNQQKIDELNQQITQIKTINTKNEVKLQTQLNKEKENFKTLFLEKKEIENHLKIKETEINELTMEDKAIYDKLLSEKKTIKQQLTEKNNEIIKQTKTINDLKKRLTQNQQKVDELNQQITQLKTLNTKNEKQLQTQLNKVKENYKALEYAKNEIEVQLKTKEVGIDQLAKEDKAVYDKLLSQKNTVEQKLIDKNKNIINLTKTINDFNRKVTKQQEKINEFEKEIVQLESKHKTEKEKLEKELQNFNNPPRPKYPKQDNDIVWQDDKHGVFTDPRDKRKYKVVKIVNQIWLAENLNFTQRIPQITNRNKWKRLENNNIDQAWCYFDNNAEYGKTCGALYTYSAALKIAPKGWHLPTKQEFETLLNNLGDKKQAYKALIKDGHSKLNVLFSGCRLSSGDFYGKENLSGFWSTTGNNATTAWYSNLNAHIKFADVSSDYKSAGISVRLLRD